MNIVGKRRWWFLLSGIMILPGIISLLLFQLEPGIDFTSGSVLSITFERPVNETEVRAKMDLLGHPEAAIQKVGDRGVFIRTKVLKEATDLDGSESEQEQILKALEQLATIESREVDTISPIVAQETVRNAIIAMVVASIAILFYITWAFRRIPNSFRYGVSAVIALAHDLLIVVGIFSILGRAINMEVNAMFIVGLLAVAGYSVNDTIVVFDRIRENVARNIDKPLVGLVNTSLMETLGRSLNTSFTTMFVLIALMLFGGPTILGLLVVLLIGVIVGTYSSIFIAAQFLVMWEQGEIGRMFKRSARSPAQTS